MIATDHEPVVEPDRAEAIRRALGFAEPGDCVLVAGKGHEREQIIGNRRIPFVDRDVVRDILVRSPRAAAAASLAADRSEHPRTNVRDCDSCCRN